MVITRSEESAKKVGENLNKLLAGELPIKPLPKKQKPTTRKQAIKELKNQIIEEKNEKLQEIENFEFEKPEKEIKTLDELKEIIIKYFPDIWEEYQYTLSTYATLSLKYLNGCPTLIKIGNPAGMKTTIDSLFYGFDFSFLCDSFTPASFVSHATNVKKENLHENDLLPKIKDKCLITPELAPLFESQRDKLIENFAMLTRVLDGEGLNRSTGSHGHRGYSGDYKFIWIGSSTPLRASVWNVMGKIGNRMFFLNMHEKKRDLENFKLMFSGKEYQEKIKICRGATYSFLKNYFKKYPPRSINWDSNKDILILEKIIKYAMLLSKLRGTLMLWKGEEKGEYEFSFPIIEEPPRAINSLRNFARGYALINNRVGLIEDDLEIVKKICFSSMPYDRFCFFELLRKYKGILTSQIIEEELKCSNVTALKTMKIFEILGVVFVENIPLNSSGHPLKAIKLNPDFMELLDVKPSIQGLNDLNKKRLTESYPVTNPYETIKPEDFIENKGKKEDTQELK